MSTLDLEARVQQLFDLEAIKVLKHSYIRCMTLSLWDEFESLLVEDIEASYSDGKYVFDDRATLLAFLRKSHDLQESSVVAYWHVTMPEIELTSTTTARGRWAMYHWYLHKPANDQQEMFAWYEDEYVKRDGRWLIARTGYKRVMEQALDRNAIDGLRLVVG